MFGALIINPHQAGLGTQAVNGRLFVPMDKLSFVRS